MGRVRAAGVLAACASAHRSHDPLELAARPSAATARPRKARRPRGAGSTPERSATAVMRVAEVVEAWSPRADELGAVACPSARFYVDALGTVPRTPEPDGAAPRRAGSVAPCSAASTCGVRDLPTCGRRLPRPAARSSRPSTRCARSSPTSATRGDAALRDAHRALRRRRARRAAGAVRRVARRARRASRPPAAALEAAHANIAAFHAAQRRPEVVHRNGAIAIRELVRPVDRAGCYVPGGRARYRPRCS